MLSFFAMALCRTVMDVYVVPVNMMNVQGEVKYQ